MRQQSARHKRQQKKKPGNQDLMGDRMVQMVQVARMYGALKARAEVLAVRVRTAVGEAPDAGMVTSEYAMGIVAVVGFAGVLVKVLAGDRTEQLLQGIVEKALSGL